MVKKTRQDKNERNIRMTYFAALFGIAMSVLFVLFSFGGVRLHHNNVQTGQEKSFVMQENCHANSNEKFCIAKTDRTISVLSADRWQDLKEDTGGKKRWTLTIQSETDPALSAVLHRRHFTNARSFQQGNIIKQWEKIKTVRIQI